MVQTQRLQDLLLDKDVDEWDAKQEVEFRFGRLAENTSLELRPQPRYRKEQSGLATVQVRDER